MIHTVFVLAEDYKKASAMRFRVPGQPQAPMKNSCPVGVAIERQIPTAYMEVDLVWYWLAAENKKRQLPAELTTLIRNWQSDLRIHGQRCISRPAPGFVPACFTYNDETNEIRYKGVLD